MMFFFRPSKTSGRRRTRRRGAAKKAWAKVRGRLGLIIVLIGLVNAALPYLDEGFNMLHYFRKPSQSVGCRVQKIVDGDTVDLYCIGKGEHRARLMGFDTPEIFSPKCLRELWRGQQASWALRQVIWQAEKIEFNHSGKDKYGRYLVRMIIDGEDLAEVMIRNGHARANNGEARAGWCGIRGELDSLPDE